MHTKERPPTHATASLKNSSGQLLQMSAGSDTLSFAYDTAGAPYSVKYNGTTYYYITDLQGDVTAIVNGSGVSVAEYTYNAWGKLLTATGTMSATLGALNPLRYRGYVYDAETGFYYLQSRYYDPGICRFISADAYASTGQGFVGYNMFAYCNNNVILYTDYSGRISACMTMMSDTGSGIIQGVWGVGVSGVLGWCLEEGGSVYYVEDHYGNKAIAVMLGGGGGLGASYGLSFISVPDAKRVQDLSGSGVSLGATVTYVGVETSAGTGACSNSATASWKSGYEFHALINYCWVILLED